MREARQLKVLVSSFALSPVKGSEFAMGWDYVRAIAAKHKVWVITRTTEREETEFYLREHPASMPNVTIHYVSWPDKSFEYPLREIPYYFVFRNWQWRVYRLALALEKEIGFDIIHQAIPSGFREPGYLWKIDKPFVWGPVGGLQYFPLRLLNAVPLKARPFFVIKNLTTFWAMHGSRRPKVAAQKASAIIAGTTLAATGIKDLWNKNAQVLCEVSAPTTSVALPARRQIGETFRIVWSGRCEPRKALNIVLLALQQFNLYSENWELVCIGDGPLMDKWKRQAEFCGIGRQCRFLGRVSRSAAMARGHCFVQPSLYDATTSVVLEALAVGVPIVCLDHFGFRDVVDAACGIRIPPGNLGQIISDFAAALQSLDSDEGSRFQMALAAMNAARKYTWMQKADTLAKIYDSIVDHDPQGTSSSSGS